MARAKSVQSTVRKTASHGRRNATSGRRHIAAKINLPKGNHEAVLRSGPHHAMVVQWTELANLYEQMVMEMYGVGQYPVAEIVPIIAYASIARMSFAMCSAAEITKGFFDPAEFGRSCERIAREQIERYRTHHENAGSALSSPVT